MSAGEFWSIRGIVSLNSESGKVPGRLTNGDLQSFLAKSQSHAQTHHNAIASCTACVVWSVKKKGFASRSTNCPHTLACRKDGQTMAGMASGRTPPKCDFEYRILAAKFALLNPR